jgi:uncharacterized protein (TIGR02588 family)
MNQQQTNKLRQSSAEKVSFLLSLSIVAAIAILIGYTWLTGDTNPPTLSVTTGTNIRQAEEQYYVPFTLSNVGGSTAESVEVIAQLLLNDGDRETGSQQFDFLSRKEQRNGEFIFTHNPQQGQLIIRVASYKLP